MTKAPFPWFGGKRRVADVVWSAFGAEVNNYVEPFFGSGAVLLGRPGGPGKIETVNDVDRMVANFWRAVTWAPDEVAHHCDWPVNEADLHARHAWLVRQLPEMREKMHADPRYFDALIAGWWVWGICQWIGGGWCAEPKNRKHPKLDGIGKGVHSNTGHQKRPQLNVIGNGIHSNEGHRKRPQLGRDKGALAPTQGKRRPVLGMENRGVEIENDSDGPPCSEWFRDLQARLRRVRVVCGDWRRVLGASVLGKGKNVGGRRPCAVFLDPPYSHEVRASGLYAEDNDIAADTCKWALEHGDDPDLRIALCGYEGEHVMPSSWTTYEWKAARGYASDDNANRERERIWFSPHCLRVTDNKQISLFSQEAAQ